MDSLSRLASSALGRVSLGVVALVSLVMMSIAREGIGAALLAGACGLVMFSVGRLVLRSSRGQREGALRQKADFFVAAGAGSIAAAAIGCLTAIV